MPKSISILAAAALVAVLAVSLAAAEEAPDVIKLRKNMEISKDMTVNDVIVIDGHVTVLGRVERNAIVVAGAVFLKPNSYVGGDVIAVGGKVFQDPTAVVVGKITQVYVPVFVPMLTGIMHGGWMAVWAAVGALALLGFIGLAILLTALIPQHMGTIVCALEKSFFMMLLWGLLWTVLIAPVAILLAISIVGIVLIPLEMLLAALALILGYIAAAIFIGDRVFISTKRLTIPFLNAIVGIAVLYLIGFVPVLGAVVKVLFLVAGFGAVMTTRFGTIRQEVR